MRRALLAVLVALLALAVYLPAGGFQFTSYDDGLYVAENSEVLGGVTSHGVAWAVRSRGYAGNWHPLTWVSHMADVSLYNLDAGKHHRTNVLLHALAAALLFLVLEAATGWLWPSVAVAALFAVHPQHVEVVAWVSERKELLAIVFWLLATAAHLGYVRRPAPWRLAAVIALAAAAFLSKPMAITLPFALLLLDGWPLGRLSARAHPAARWDPFLEKLPLFALAAVTALLTIQSQRAGGATQMLQSLSLAVRIGTAVAAAGAYILKTLWPADLAILYRHTEMMPGALPLFTAGVLLLGVSALAVAWRRCHPWLAVGWAWYLGTLLPVLGLIQFGRQSMADRYTYLPHIGLFLAAAGIARSCLRRWPRGRVTAGVLAIAALSLFSCAAREQLWAWRDTGTLFTKALAVDPDNDMAHLSLAIFLHKGGHPEAALPHYREAVRLRPADPDAWLGLGLAEGNLGRPRDEIAAYRQAIVVAPGYLRAYVNLAAVCREQGLVEEAARAERYLQQQGREAAR
jgi:hypothetical protein